MEVLSQTLKRPLVLIGEGYGSIVYASADDIILRVAKNAITQQRHEHERRLLKLIAPYIKSLAIPKPTILIKPTSEFPFGAIGYKKIDGVPLTPELITPHNQEAIAFQIAAFIHEVHSIKPGWVTKHFTLPVFPPTTDELQVIWKTVEPHLYQSLQSDQLHAASTWFKNALHVLSITKVEPTLLHGDLWYENMIFKDDKLAGVIDFENVMFGHPIKDFMTQEYLGHDFKNLVLKHYEKFNQTFIYDQSLANILMGIREIEGLEYGITTNNIDEDQDNKIIMALHL